LLNPGALETTMKKPKKQKPVCTMTVCVRRMLGDWCDQYIELEGSADGTEELDLDDLIDLVEADGWRVRDFASETYFPKAPPEPAPEATLAQGRAPRTRYSLPGAGIAPTHR
jgi:hypothetical protein